MTTDEALDRLVGVPRGRVNDLLEVLDEPQIAARDGVVSYEHPRLGEVRQFAAPYRLGNHVRARAGARRGHRGTAARPVRIRRRGAAARPGRRRLRMSWNGRFFEDFTVGDVYVHPLGRTVLPVDNSWFTLLTQNTAPLHFDAHYASQTEWGKPLVDSTFTLALVTGQSVTDVSQNVMANLGWDEVRLPAPVFEGDTIYSESEVLSVRESGSRPNVGVVTVRTRGYNQDGVVVITFKRTLLVYKRSHAPFAFPAAARCDLG